MTYALLKTDFHGAVALVTLDRPRAMNALSLALRHELDRCFANLADSPSVRAVVLTGRGKAFCAGLDLKELETLGYDPLRSAPHVDAILGRFKGPIIGAINGYAITGGFELALACDILLASDQARFMDTHLTVGVLPGWGLSQKLSRVIGPSRSKQMAFSGEPMDAYDAKALGLVSEICSPNQLISRALELATSIAKHDTNLTKAYKQVIDAGAHLPLGEALAFEKRCSAGGLTE